MTGTADSCPSYWVHIHIAGDKNAAVQTCRKFCTAHTSLCVTVTSTIYCYPGGAEDGVTVRLLNYPRFPESPLALLAAALNLAEALRVELAQDSYTVETPTESEWHSHRGNRR